MVEKGSLKWKGSGLFKIQWVGVQQWFCEVPAPQNRNAMPVLSYLLAGNIDIIFLQHLVTAMDILLLFHTCMENIISVFR